MNKKSLKYGSNSILLVVIVLALAVIINLLVGLGDFRWDLTSSNLYSLSEDSKKILNAVKKEVTIYGLFDDGHIPAGSQYKELINLLDEYKDYGIKVTYVDPDKDPGTLTFLDKDKTKGIAKGDFVVKSGNKVKRLIASELYGENSMYGRVYKAEPLITGAIKFVTADSTPIAYFVEGHSEYSLTSNLTQLRADIENNNFEAKSLSLMTVEKIPDDCKLLIFASPKVDLSESEKIVLKTYLEAGGRAVFLFDPIESDKKMTNFEEILATYNVALNYDKVRDTTNCLPGDEYSLIAALTSNKINSSFNSYGEFQVLMPDSRSLSVLQVAKEWLTTTSLITTSYDAESVKITDQDAIEKGPFPLAIASEISGGSKILVFGNGTFLTDAALMSRYASYFSNGKVYFTSTLVNWLSDKTDETTISPKIVSTKSLSTTKSQAKIISIILIGVVPVIILVIGLVVWTRRRHL
ncbi:GldG family protein [Ruminiclostridium herbifermentans]|uniref:GldG family protein n=1 Tax=Ruminiclostridium herbifermentans TaxID=2488810 RepID=A0A4U7JGD0_9FIRM|nr:GldG family protein [Ruminiclostridium herbifermentans]